MAIIRRNELSFKLADVAAVLGFVLGWELGTTGKTALRLGHLGGCMHNSVKRSERRGFGHLWQKLKSLGVDDTGIDAVLSRVHVNFGRVGEDIVAVGQSQTHSTVLLEGVGCLYERLANGSRQIYSFQYPGDFCDLNRQVLPQALARVGVAAITPCSFGTIRNGDMEELFAQHPAIASAMWRASLLEANMLRQRLLNVGRRAALQRVAHLLCEQLARQEAVGIFTAAIPLRGSDLADALGLSIVHVKSHHHGASEARFACERGPLNERGGQDAARCISRFRRQLSQHAAASFGLAGRN